MTTLKSAFRPALVSLALLLVTFVGGLLAGAAIERTVRASPGEAPSLRSGSPSRPAPGREARASRFMEQIGLTEEQQAQIDSILRHGRAETQSFWENEGSRLREIVEETRQGVHSVLTPEQREQYDSLLRSRRGGGPRGEGGASAPRRPRG